MVAEATRVRGRDEHRLTAAAAVASGEVYQLANGQAGVYTGLDAAASSDRINLTTEGQVTLIKAASLVFTDGAPLYWDHSANNAVLFPASDRDFFIGTCVDDATSSATSCVCNLNVRPSYKIDLGRGALEDEFLTVIVKTVVGSTTVEVPHVERMGGTHAFIFGATAEAQKLDLLSQQGFSVASNWIVEGGFNVIDDGDASAIDFNIGVANATHASNADTITESCFLHLDGNDLNLFAESDDGTTEVAATDTTLDYTEGSAVANRVHVMFDLRNLADIQVIVNGALALPASVFKLDAATGPLFLLAHVEKTASTDTYELAIDALRCWYSEQ